MIKVKDRAKGSGRGKLTSDATPPPHLRLLAAFWAFYDSFLSRVKSGILRASDRSRYVVVSCRWKELAEVRKCCRHLSIIPSMF